MSRARIACIFRLKADSDSVSIRTPIPVQSGHRFRLIPATFLRGPESEAALDNLHKMGQDASFERRYTMARTRLSMQKIREVFRLKASGLSYRDSHLLERCGMRPKSAISQPPRSSLQDAPCRALYHTSSGIKADINALLPPVQLSGGKLMAPAS